MPKSKIHLGVVGCGNISSAYFNGCKYFEHVEIVACADLDVGRAEARAAEHSVPKACTVEALLDDPNVDIVINLTIPKAHGTVSLQALAAGKSVYNEKPLALTRDEARQMLQTARDKGLLIGGAPDTFYGASHQTARKLIDDGAIGEPVGAFCSMMSRGHESWHPDPEFYYKPGGGPMFDMGPYYLTDLINLLGPVRRVSGTTRVTFPQRTITSEAKHGQIIDVEVPTFVNGLLDFHSGALGTILTTFDVFASDLPRIEIYGAEGSLAVPDPNGFGGTVRIRRPGDEEWRDVEYSHTYTEPGRSAGVADMARALLDGKTALSSFRANGEVAYHVLDLMHAFHDSSEQGRHIELESTRERPAPLPPGPIRLD